MRLILLLAGASVSACAPEQPRAARQSTEAADLAAAEAPAEPARPGGAFRLPDPPAPPPPAPMLPGLLPLSPAQVAPSLGSSPICALSDRGTTLMAAKPGIAIVNDRGRIVHLKPDAEDWEALREGGTFRAARLRIEVDAGAVLAQGPERIERDASVAIVRGRRGFGSSHGPAWVCES